MNMYDIEVEVNGKWIEVYGKWNNDATGCLLDCSSFHISLDTDQRVLEQN